MCVCMYCTVCPTRRRDCTDSPQAAAVAAANTSVFKLPSITPLHKADPDSTPAPDNSFCVSPVISCVNLLLHYLISNLILEPRPTCSYQRHSPSLILLLPGVILCSVFSHNCGDFVIGLFIVIFFSHKSGVSFVINIFVFFPTKCGDLLLNIWCCNKFVETSFVSCYLDPPSARLL